MKYQRDVFERFKRPWTFTEKKDLVELVIRQSGPDDAHGVGPSGSSGGSGSSGEQPRPRRMPEERQKSFPKAYVESTHRHEWLEKMENAQKHWIFFRIS